MSIFVLVSAETCGHCKTFKAQHLNKLLDNLSKINGLTILHANFPDRSARGFFGTSGSPGSSGMITNFRKDIFHFITNKKDGTKLSVNPKLETLIPGFPIFLLFSLENWNNPNNLNGLALNGTIVDSTLQTNKSGQPVIARTAEAITEWVKNNLDTISNTSIPVVPTTPKLGSTDTFKNQDFMPKYVEPSRIRIKVSPQSED